MRLITSGSFIRGGRGGYCGDGLGMKEIGRYIGVRKIEKQKIREGRGQRSTGGQIRQAQPAEKKAVVRGRWCQQLQMMAGGHQGKRAGLSLRGGEDNGG